MSLFKAREWWSTWCGGSDEEFDIGNLCVANIDNSSNGFDKIVIGSMNGVLRIFLPKKENFKPNDLMLETQMNQPILQIASGRFVSGTDQLHICLLHPRSLCVYNVTAVSGSAEHANHFTLTKMYEHRLERTAASMTFGGFGGVKEKDFICVLSMDGVLTFYEQETFSLQAYLPEFLLPGPLLYIPSTDSFVVSTAGRTLEAYRYHSVASSSIGDNKKSKKMTSDWTKSLGEHILDMQMVNSTPPTIIIMGERSMFKLSTGGNILMMKKLEYNPSALFPYVQPGKDDDSSMCLVGSHNSSLQVYNGIELVWAAQLPHVPVACRIGKFEELSGVLVTLDEFGHLYTSYLGTDPSLFVAPQVESRMGNIEELEKELKYLNSTIKKSESGISQTSHDDDKEKLSIHATVATHLDEVSQCIDEGEEGNPYPSITVKVTLQCRSIKPIENISLVCSAKYPLVCTQSQIDVPVIGTKGPELSFDVGFYTVGGALPSELHGSVIATYSDEKEAPHVLQSDFKLPLSLIAEGSTPLKQSQYKEKGTSQDVDVKNQLTLESNKEQVNLGELFPDMTGDSVIPTPVMGIQYYGGPVVTILTSKQSNRYRVQSDSFEAMYLIIIELVARLEEYFKEKSNGPGFQAGFTGPLPLTDYYDIIDAHFEQRLLLNTYKELLNQRASQFRVIQKRLLTRFKDKTPSPLNHLDTILDGTYKQILALADEYSATQLSLKNMGNALSIATKLMNYLIGLFANLDEECLSVLNACLTPIVSESHDMGWEETIGNNMNLLLHTCLAKSSKDQHSMPTPLTEMEKDTVKLKKNIGSVIDRLSKIGSLKLHKPSGPKTMNNDEGDNATLMKRLTNIDEQQEKDIAEAMQRVKVADTPER